MKALLAGGFWGTSHWILDSIGRGTTWLSHARVSPHDDEVYTMIGGGAIGAICGAWLGFVASAQSGGSNTIAATVIGTMVGLCSGVFCGAIVYIVDVYIDALVDSTNFQRESAPHYDRLLIHRR